MERRDGRTGVGELGQGLGGLEAGDRAAHLSHTDQRLEVHGGAGAHEVRQVVVHAQAAVERGRWGQTER